MNHNITDLSLSHRICSKSSIVWILCVLTLSACGGGGGGSLSPSTSNGNLLLINSGYTGSLDANRVLTFQSRQEFKNTAYYSKDGNGSLVASSIHPFTLTNVDQAYGYGLSGVGVTIGFVDSGFASPSDYTQNNAFLEMKTKRPQISFVSSINNPCSGNSCNPHGTNVVSIATANFDNQGDQFFLTNEGVTYNAYSGGVFPQLDHGMMGVAYDANIRIGDFNAYNGSLSGISQLTNAMAGVKVLNNSWGLPYLMPSNVPGDIANYSTLEASTWLRQNTGGILAASDIANLYTAYKNVQTSGVVVFALQNEPSDQNPSMMAALPQVFPDLEDAWIAVGNIDTRGATRDALTNVARQSAPCGSTARYCLVVDGTELTGAGLYRGDGYNRGVSGTSFAAPQVSGMIALLAQAFPSLSPDQLAARLLATAYNRFPGFRSAGSKSFGNGIVHLYSNEFGHGIPDMKAALNPIVSNSVPLGFVMTGSPSEGDRISLRSTSISSPELYGDSIKRAMIGKQGVVYDALAGGFAVDLARLTNQFPSHFALKADAPARLVRPRKAYQYQNNFASEGALIFGINSNLSSLDDYALSKNISITSDAPSSVNTYFALTENSRGIINSTLDVLVGLRINRTNRLEGFAARGTTTDNFLVARNSHWPNSAGYRQGVGQVGFAFHSDMENWREGVGRFTSKLGFRHEINQAKGLVSSGALNVSDSTNSVFWSPKITFSRGGLSLASEFLGEVSFLNSSSSLIQIRGPVISTSIMFKANWAHGEGDRDNTYLKLWQPERLELAKATLRLPKLVGPGTPVYFDYEKINLRPSSRTINIGLGHQKYLSKSQALTYEIFHSVNPNHSRDSKNYTAVRTNWIYSF